MKRSTILLVMLSLGGCMGHIPTAIPIHDNKQAVITRDTDIGQQTLYKDETLTHYRIDGVDSFCTGLISMDLGLYRCFAVEGGMLTKGLNPRTSRWEPLATPVPISE